MRTILLSLTALAISGGVASADRMHGNPSHGTNGGSHGPVVTHPQPRGDVRDHRTQPRYEPRHDQPRGVRTRYEQPRYEQPREQPRYERPHYEQRTEYVRSRPIVRERYFDYRVRPQVIVETVAPQDGYVWVAGEWQWNGAEWMWTDGHYEALDYDDYRYE